MCELIADFFNDLVAVDPDIAVAREDVDVGARFPAGVSLAAVGIFAMALLAAATRGASSGLPPGTQDGVAGCGSGIFLANGQKFPSDEPAHCRLHGSFRYANGLCESLIADLDRCVPRPLCMRQPEIHEETDGSTVMADEVAHEHVDDVFVYGRHRCTNYLYSNSCLIATFAATRYALTRLGGQT